MPTIEFVGAKLKRPKQIEVADGGELVDICDEHFAPVPFSCRSASCGTCYIEILEGAELFEPPNPDERELLELLGGIKTHRLACQARVKAGPGKIRVRPALAG